MSKDKHQCAGGEWDGWKFIPCPVNGSLEHNDRWWCRRHHPPTRDARNKERDTRWQEKQEAEMRQARRKALILTRTAELVAAAKLWRFCDDARDVDLEVAIDALIAAEEGK